MRRFTTFATLATACALVASGAVAQQAGTAQQESELRQNNANQQSTTQQQRRQQQTQQQSQLRRQDRSQRAGQGASSIVRASELIGVEVKNHNDEDLGSIEDLAIDPKSGKIAYAAVSMGGFLGMGDELFAVPWDAIQLHSEEATAPGAGEAERVAILNVTKEQMENAQGFDQENWPDMANEQWRQANDRRYQSLRTGANPDRLQNPQ